VFKKLVPVIGLLLLAGPVVFAADAPAPTTNTTSTSTHHSKSKTHHTHHKTQSKKKSWTPAS
ncbi:MAG: hypothetical protein WBE92_05620, partial [Steroidobacteraceae bacterium]